MLTGLAERFMRPSRLARLLTVGTAMPLLLAGCATGSTGPGATSSVSTYHHIRFVRPPGWREVPATASSGLESPVAYWTNQHTVPQCTHPQRGEIDCHAPVKAVHRNGVLVLITQSTYTYKRILRPNVTVAGRPASITVRTCDGSRSTTESAGARCYPGASRALVADVFDPHVHRPGHSIAVQLLAYLGPGNTDHLEQQLRHALASARPTSASPVRRTQPHDVARRRS